MNAAALKTRVVTFVEGSRWMEAFFWLFIAGFFISIVLMEVVAGVYLLLFVGLLLSGKIPWGDRMSQLIIGYVILGIIGYTLSPTNNYLVHLVLLCFVPLTFWMSAEGGIKTRKWIQGIILLATATAVAGIVNHFLGEERVSGFHGGYFTLATLMVWSFPLTVARFFDEQRSIRWMYLVSMLLQVAALWWTYTRSALLGVFVAFGIWGIIWLVRASREKTSLAPELFRNWGVVVLILAGIVAFLFFSNDPRMNPITSVNPERAPEIDVTSGRGSLVQDAISILSNDWKSGAYGSIIVGHGLSSREGLVGDKYTSWESDVLQSLMDHGMLGLILIVTIYVEYLRQIWRGLRRKDHYCNGLAAAGIVTVMMSFFTLRITGWHSAGVFILNYSLLFWSLKTHRADTASGTSRNGTEEEQPSS